MSVIAQEGRPVSEVCSLFDPVPQVLQNVRYKAGEPLKHSDVEAAIKHARTRLGKDGRLVIRPSGTEPLIRVMGEGDDETLVRTVVGDIVSALEHVA
jgi:phosphoglucosamine mutase